MAAAEVFMDSAGFRALWDADDEHHTAAVRLFFNPTRQAESLASL
jgi:hypothetical protein